MFGLFSKKCPVIASDKLWVEQRLCWLAETFGFDRMLDAAAIVPSHEWFPHRFSGSPKDIEKMFAHVCGLMQVDPNRFELIIHDEAEEDSEPLGLYYGRERNGRERISILRQEASDPMSLVATISHELGHALLLGDGRITALVPDHEWVTDLTTVFLGFGVFGGNTAIRERSETVGRSYYWQLSRRGYMSELQYAYALAVFAWTRGETKPSWATILRPNVRAPMQESLRYLAKTSDSIIGPQGFARVGSEHEGQGTGELLHDLRSISASKRLAALRELGQRHLPPSDVVEPVADLLKDSDPSVSDAAASLLGSFAGDAQAAVPALLRLAESPDHFQRIIALRTLGEIGTDAREVVPELAMAMDDREPLVRQQAIAALGEYGDQSAAFVQKLSNQLESLHNENIRAPTSALGKMGQAALPAVPNLIRVIHEGEGESREAAAVALGEIDDSSEEVIAALRDAVADDDHTVREAALGVLARLNLDRRDVQHTLRQAIEHPDLETRTWAALALSKSDGQAAVGLACLAESMVSLLCPDNGDAETEIPLDLYPLLAFAFTDIGPTAVQPLVEMLNAKDHRQRTFAAWALGRIGIPAGEAAAALRRLQTDEDRTTRLVASLALWNTARQADGVVPTLIDLLRSCELSRPLDHVFQLCEVGKPAAGSSTVFLERLRDPRDIDRAVIHLALREIGDAAVRPLIALLPSENDAIRNEIVTVLAAIAHAAADDVLSAEAKLIEHTLDVRKWISLAQSQKQSLANKS